MKKLYIIANWKSNNTSVDAAAWLSHITAQSAAVDIHEKSIIVCPPFHLLSQINASLQENNSAISVGAQDVSPFSQGAYTGEINAQQLKEVAQYTIIGHSERRKYFQETDDLLTQKVLKALEHDLIPIFCVQDETTFVPDGVKIVAYEPITAIGTGTPDTPENAQKVIEAIKMKYPQVESVLYGGSVSSDNVALFTKIPCIDGVLVGGASLDAQKFIQIIFNS